MIQSTRRIRGLAATVAVFALALAAAPASAQSLQEALAAAYASNPTLTGQRASQRATDENVPQALAGWRPSVSFTGNAGYQSIDTETSGRTALRTPSNTAETNPYQVTLQATQPLYKFTTNPQIDSAEATVLAGRATLTATEQTVLLNGTTAYLTVLRDGAVLELNRNNEQVLRRQLEATQDRFRVGEVTRTDVAQAEAALAGAVASRIQAEGNLVTSRANFEQVFGFPPGTLTQPPLPNDLPRSEDEAWAQAQDQNPDYAAARYREIASKYDIDATTGQLLPQFNLVGQLNRSNETTTPDLTTNSAQILGQVTMPLYEAGSVYSQVRQRKQVNSQRKLQIDETGRQVRRNAVSTWENLLTARANIESLQAQVNANRIALDGIQQEAAVGSRTVLDVLITEQNLLNSEVALVRARYDEAVASYSLKAVVGTMTAPGMKLPVELYDPTENYKRVRNKWLGLGIGNGD